MNFKCAMRSRFPLLHLRWKDFAPGDVRMIQVSKPTAKPKAKSKAKAKAAGVKAAPKQGQKRPHAAVAGDPDMRLRKASRWGALSAATNAEAACSARTPATSRGAKTDILA